MANRRTKRATRTVRATTKSKSKSSSTTTANEAMDPMSIEEEHLLEAIETVNSLDEAPPMDARRRRRARPTPTFLLEQQDQDAIAKRRTLMILRVLSGETPVTDAIEGTDISRQAYYQLEERALRAMMRALTPGADTTVVTGPDPTMLRRIAELEARTKMLEQEKRRAERMLYLTRKVMPTGPMKSGHRGRPMKASSSTTRGSAASHDPTTRNSTSSPKHGDDPSADSIRRRSADEPHGGTAS